MGDWKSGYPPVTEQETGQESYVWYDVLYADESTGRSCWWHDHWYCNENWIYIIGWKEIE